MRVLQFAGQGTLDTVVNQVVPLGVRLVEILVNEHGGDRRLLARGFGPYLRGETRYPFLQVFLARIPQGKLVVQEDDPTLHFRTEFL